MNIDWKKSWEQTPQVLSVGDYTISPQDDGSFWITDETGLGLTIPKEKFVNLITDFYYEES